MKLVAVTLKNFRGYQDDKTIQIGDLTTIIGRNDVGKSSILEALEVFFNNETVKIDNLDSFFILIAAKVFKGDCNKLH